MHHKIVLIQSFRTNKKSKGYFCCQLGTVSVPLTSTDLALRCTVLYDPGSPSKQSELCDDMTGRWLIRLAWRFQEWGGVLHGGNWALPSLSALCVGSWQMLSCSLLCLTWMIMRLEGICMATRQNGLNILTFSAQGGVLGVNLISF